MTETPFVLLPPSEAKQADGDGPPYDPAAGAFGRLAAGRRRVARALRRRDFDAADQLGVSGRALAKAVTANRSLDTAATLPALRRYTGVLYGALAYPAQPPEMQERLDQQVVVVSGLLGLVRGGDPVPAYKVPMTASLPGLGRLASYWRPRLVTPLAELLGDAVVWDLLPAAHGAAITVPTGARCWRVTVQREVAGSRRTVSHDNKAVKGALVAAIVGGQLGHPDQLGDWEGPGGYRVVPDAEGAARGQVALVARA